MVKTLVLEDCSIKATTGSLGLPRSTYYRHSKPVFTTFKEKQVRDPANKLPQSVREEILNVLHSEKFVDRNPWEVVPTLLDEGIYLGSIRSFYRILSEANENGDRRLQRRHTKRHPPVLKATEPNKIWSWDITRLNGPRKGEYYYLYLMIDIFSRYITGWMIGVKETAFRAQHFIRETIRKQFPLGQGPTIHSDNGAPMKANSTRALLPLLGAKESFSRPRTSDDNPFSEAGFKTIKYSAGFPTYFESLEDANRYFTDWVNWYNTEHKHSGLNLFTPFCVHTNQVEPIAMKREEIMFKAYNEHPERFSKGKPVIKRNPKVSGINLHFKPHNAVEINEEFGVMA